MNPGKGGTSLALGDINGDGYLDLYVANYRTQALMDMPETHFKLTTVNGQKVVVAVNGRPVTSPDLIGRFNVSERGRIEENGEVDVLYLNVYGTNVFSLPFTNGVFLDVAGKPLTEPPYDWGLTAAFRDLNDDGLPDLYVCNDFDTPDRVWLNQGTRFQAAPPLTFRKSPLFCMGLDFADVNRDGADDLFLLDMMMRRHVERMDFQPDRNPLPSVIGRFEDRPQYMMSMLFLNRGDGTYAEIGQLAGVAANDWAWSAAFLDVDLDGWEDLLVVNGNERTSRSMDIAARLKAMRTGKQLSPLEILRARTIYPRHNTPNLAFRNRRDLTFEEMGSQWGFATRTISHGIALADLDNDGDLDVVLNNLNDPAGIFRNRSSAPRLAVRLRGTPPNTKGIGAKITVKGGGPVQSQEMMCGGRYLSSDDPQRVFAAGAITNELTIEVRWRSGRRSVVQGVRPNRVYELDESEAGEPLPPHTAPEPFFRDVSSLLGHVHHEDLFDDFARQPTLPNRLSQLGPGVAWFDLDGDDREDLLVGTGRGGELAAYRNLGGHGFELLPGAPWNQPLARDQTTLVAWRKAGGAVRCLAGSANYEDGAIQGSVAREYDPAGRRISERLPGQKSSTGPLALGDLDGDGDLDLFVGGRVLPGRYPAPASSLLFRDEAGDFRRDTVNVKKLDGLGLVSGAVFSDLTGDGYPELVLACEWGPIRVFRNQDGDLTDATAELGLSPYVGWWNGVTTGDFDEDGRLDIVASNWGRNTRCESDRTQPLSLFFGDFDGNDTLELIEAHYDPELQKVVPSRLLEFLVRGWPLLKERFPSNQAYGRAGIEEVLGETFHTAGRLQANWLESTLFLNRSTGFVARLLPIEAQFAPAFGVCVGDYDGDGHEDVFLSQNFFATQPETPRYDAGRGLWLRGDGQGRLTAVSAEETGIKVYGEQRGCALSDFDADGRVDLVVTQNGAETKLYRNVGAPPGLRVRLRGPAGNRDGVGAVLRLGPTPADLGPAREIHAGSGYWSQDGAVQIFASLSAPATLWVRWPGGLIQTTNLPPATREITVDYTDPEEEDP